MSESYRQPPTGKVILPGVLEEFRKALEEEIDCIKKSGQSSILLRNGYEIRHDTDNYWYQFKVDYAPSIPEDTPCKLIVGTSKYDVSVISYSGSEMILRSRSIISGPLSSVRLENGSTVLMEKLIACIEQNVDHSNPAGHRMLPLTEPPAFPCHKIHEYSAEEIPQRNETCNQYRAVMSALENDITYIWGPPGTGKTSVIARIVEELYSRDRSVLLVSHTNTAVTGAIEHILDPDKGHHIPEEPCPILRLGKPDRTWPKGISLKEHTDILGKDLYEEEVRLEAERKQLEAKHNDILVQLAKAHWVEQSQLEAVGTDIAQLKQYKDYVQTLHSNQKTIIAQIKQEENLHPECALFHKLTGMLGYKKAQYIECSKKLTDAEHQQALLSDELLIAQDELRKHDAHAALIARQSTMMTPHFLREKIVELSRQYQQVQGQINELSEAKAKNDTIISDYEKKNTVIKFFSGKSAVLSAQAENGVILSKISPLQEEIETISNLTKTYQGQLQDAEALEMQIRNVLPQNTKPYWSQKISGIQSQLDAIAIDLEHLHTSKHELSKDIAALEVQISASRKYWDIIKELQKQRDEVTNRLQATESAIRDLTDHCQALLCAECQWCHAFAEIENNASSEELYAKLQVLYQKAAVEVSEMDIPNLQTQHEELEKSLLKVKNQLDEIYQKLRELEKQAILEAPIVGATLTKTYLSEELRERSFDTVILDEASMASIPALWCASYLAEQNIVIVGDFLQLSPIVLSDGKWAQQWLGTDIFTHSHIRDVAESGSPELNHFIKLNDQFRMEEKIANIANLYYNRGKYGGLKSNDTSTGRKKARKEFTDWYPGLASESPVRLIDTESLHAWVTGIPQGKGHSRLNCFSAAVDVDLAFNCIAPKLEKLNKETPAIDLTPSVLIVAPYKPHVKFLNNLIEDKYKKLGFKYTPSLIQAGTIHSFQGSEADIVIFDLVVDEPHWSANLFMTSEDINSEMEKLFNVAVTRAKFRLFLVGNFAYCQKKAKNNALAVLLHHLLSTESLEKEDAKTLLPSLVFTPPSGVVKMQNMDQCDFLCNESTFYSYFEQDIRSLDAGELMLIYSPFMTRKKIGELRPEIMNAIGRGARFIIVTKSLEERGKKEFLYYQDCEDDLRALGIQVIHKYGMHEKLIFVGNRAIWTGSLNALSSTGDTREIMERRSGESALKHYRDFMDIDHIQTTANAPSELICPICGRDMQLKESRDGGVYWECVSGDFSRSADQPYPVDGVITCRKCGKPLKFMMKTEPRWVCTDNPKHYQKMREGDLKLEKMRALIPTKRALHEVEKFFAAKQKSRLEPSPKASVKETNSNQIKLF